MVVAGADPQDLPRPAGAVLATHPVAYVCVFELASSKSMVSSGADALVVWEIEDGELVPVMHVPRGLVEVTRDRVQAAAAKKYDGVWIASGANPQDQLRLALYNDSFWGLILPMRGADLDQAVDALQRGG